MQGSNRKRVGVVLAAILLGGCVTQTPRLVRYPEEQLVSGYSGYFSADVAGNRQLFADLLAALEVESDAIVNRTNRITGGFDLGLLGANDVAAVAYGTFPQGLTQFSLRRNRGFREAGLRDDETGVFVQVLEDPDEFPLHVFVPRDDVLLMSSGTEAVETLRLLNRDSGQGRQTMRRSTYSQLIAVGGLDGPIATVVFENPGSNLLGFLGVDAPGIPITGISLSLFDRVDELFLEGTLVTRTAREAALFSRLSRFFVLLFVRSLGLDPERAREDVELSVENTVVGFSNIPISREELAGIVRSFGGVQ